MWATSTSHLLTVVLCVHYSVALATGKFDVVEQIKAYQGIRPTWKGFVVDLRTELYILVNVADE
jgi:hypothetical protein